MIVACTRNQWRALGTLAPRLVSPAAVFGFPKVVSAASHSLEYRDAALLYLLMIPFAAYQAWKLRSKNGSFKKVSFGEVTIRLAQAAGWMIYWERQFRLNPPLAVLVANDITPLIRGISEAASQVGIPSIYIQHAAVTSIFPPPTCYDVMLLDGPISKDIYSKIGGSGAIIKEIGAIRCRHSERTGTLSDAPYDVGIAINGHVSVERLKNLLQNLRRNSRVSTVTIKLHPAQSAAEWEKVLHPLNEIRLVSGLDCLYDSFLDSIDFLIVNNTSAAHDAMVYGVPTFYASLDEESDDYYGFVKNGILARWSEELLSGERQFIDTYWHECSSQLSHLDVLAGKSLRDHRIAIEEGAALIEFRIRRDRMTETLPRGDVVVSRK